jgi:hypothetical protein
LRARRRRFQVAFARKPFFSRFGRRWPRVARWYIFNPENLFGKIYYGLGMRKVSRFCGNLEYIMATWYILRAFGNLWQFGIFSPVLVYFVKKNLATLRWPQTQKDGRQKRLVRPSRTIFFEDVFLFAAVCLLSTLTGRVARCF